MLEVQHPVILIQNRITPMSKTKVLIAAQMNAINCKVKIRNIPFHKMKVQSKPFLKYIILKIVFCLT